VQAIYRGQRQRKQSAEETEAAARVQAIHRGQRQRKQSAAEVEAAVRVQALVRGRAQRGASQTAHGDALLKMYRNSTMPIPEVRNMTEDEAALRMQALQRGRQARALAEIREHDNLWAAGKKANAAGLSECHTALHHAAPRRTERTAPHRTTPH
jgi:hypothetical protein